MVARARTEREQTRLYRWLRGLQPLCGNGATVEPVRHRQTKEAATDMFNLRPPRHTSTLPNLTVQRPAVWQEITESGRKGRWPSVEQARELCLGFR
jgi:hypothetical protein